MNNAFMQDSQLNSICDESPIINKINDIKTENIVEEYTVSNERTLNTDIYIEENNISQKYRDYIDCYELYTIYTNHNNLYIAIEDGDKQIVEDIINKAMSYVTLLSDNELQQITNSFLNETLNLAQNFTKLVKHLKEKVVVPIEEIKNNINKCKLEYEMITQRKIKLLLNLDADIVNYIDSNLKDCSRNVKKCLEDKICGTIREVIKIYEEQQQEASEEEDNWY